MTVEGPVVERATIRDLPALEALVSAAELPLDGARAAFRHGVVARVDGRVAGGAAIEPYGPVGLLRSVVVAADRRGEGLGRAVVAAAERLAAELGMTELYLLTETAEGWFSRLGYERIERAEIPAAVQDSVEFTTACATTAAVMVRRLPR